MHEELTFLLTDVEGSTRLWERAPEEMRAALARHDAIIRAAITRHGGQHKQARGEGDSHFAVFGAPREAVVCALEVQRGLAREEWPAETPLLVRVGIHCGPAETRDDDYYGPTINRTARLRSIGHGGQTLVSGSVASAVGSLAELDVDLKDRGHQRLKDLEEPLRVFELTHPDLPDDFPPLNSLDGRRHNLPIQLTSFIGREYEMALLTKLVADSARVVTIAGTGGVGKTRLSLQVAAELVDSFPDGAWLVQLANVTEPSRIAREVLHAVGDPSETDTTDDLVELLRPRQTLLVLDNCEQVVAGVADVVRAIAERCPHVAVLATSREPLAVPGEKLIRLAGMSVPASDKDQFPDLYPAIRLFVERAQAVEPSFVLDDGDRAAVASVCRRLDGLPLAIELAAARVRVLSPQDIADRLQDRFALLTGGPRTGDERQRTMRAAIDWSHDLLAEDQRVLFRRLSVFSGGWTLEAAESVCAAPPISSSGLLDGLTDLVDKSLVVRDSSGSGARYRMLESIHAYARERLDAAGELAALQDAHLRWVAERTSQRPAPGAGDPAAASIAVLREESDNIRAALDHAARCDPRSGLEVMWNTMDAWDSYANSSEGLRRVRSLLEHHQDPDASRLYGLSLLGILARNQGLVDVSRSCLEEAVAISRERAHDERLAANLVTLAELAQYDGRVAEAEARLAEAEQIARKSGELSGLAHVLTGMGRIAMERDTARSVSLLEEALRLRRDLREGHHVQALLENLASMYERQGRPEEARVAAQEAKELATAAGDEESVTALALSLGRIAQDEGQFEEAERCFREVQVLAAEKGLPNEEGYAWALLGENSRAVNDIEAARDRYSRARDCFDRAGNVVTVAFLNGNLGHIALTEGQPGRSARARADRASHRGSDPDDVGGRGIPGAVGRGRGRGGPHRDGGADARRGRRAAGRGGRGAGSGRSGRLRPGDRGRSRRALAGPVRRALGIRPVPRGVRADVRALRGGSQRSAQ